MQRDTAACTARKLETNPMTNMMSSGLAIPDPRCAVRVSATGSPACSVSTWLRLGMARINAALENITMSPTPSRLPMMAFGTLRAGSSTSSAIEPAASNPRNAQPA